MNNQDDLENRIQYKSSWWGIAALARLVFDAKVGEDRRVQLLKQGQSGGLSIKDTKEKG